LSGYDKATMACDIRELVRHLGYDRVNLAGRAVPDRELFPY
jgi:hypothetical protein